MAEAMKKGEGPKGMAAEKAKAEARKREQTKEKRNTPAGKSPK